MLWGYWVRELMEADSGGDSTAGASPANVDQVAEETTTTTDASPNMTLPDRCSTTTDKTPQRSTASATISETFDSTTSWYTS